MTEEDAIAWIADRFGKPAVDRMRHIAEGVTAESERQNLVARSTLSSIWARHIVDSAQLVEMAGPIASGAKWIDIGSGAGFPGLVVAGLSDADVILVEPRKRRAAFLDAMISALGLRRTRVLCARIESVAIVADFISARAVSHLHDLFALASQCTNATTRWILPKGRSATEELESVAGSWHGVFHVEQSLTDPHAMIVIASGVARR